MLILDLLQRENWISRENGSEKWKIQTRCGKILWTKATFRFNWDAWGKETMGGKC